MCVCVCATNVCIIQELLTSGNNCFLSPVCAAKNPLADQPAVKATQGLSSYDVIVFMSLCLSHLFPTLHCN